MGSSPQYIHLRGRSSTRQIKKKIMLSTKTKICFGLLTICLALVNCRTVRTRAVSEATRIRRSPNPHPSLQGEINGEAALRSLPSSRISKLVRVIDQLRAGRLNIRDLDRQDANSIKNLMASYGMSGSLN